MAACSARFKVEASPVVPHTTHQTKGLAQQPSDCLWEMGDVVAMLDAGQGKEESDARPPFEVYE
jgi:hypothetical protein